MAAVPKPPATFHPHNPYVCSLLTDLYQITMGYAYWNTKTHERSAVFDLFFRKNPFKGEYTVFAGLEEAMRYIHDFRFHDDHIAYLREQLPDCDEGYFEWLASVDCSQVKVYAIKEGSVVFPRVPLLRLEGPLGVVQLLETCLLNTINYATLVATNAARMKKAAGPGKTMLEFGLRRAQGPDGALSASRYAYLGGFNGTSNVLSGFMFNIKIGGTHAHSFVTSFASFDDLLTRDLKKADSDETVDLVELSLKYRAELGKKHTNEGELAAFIAYAQAFPNGFLALVDTYDTLGSGVPNFLSVALALHELGYKAKGIRLDSGDLAYLSIRAREMFTECGEKYGYDYFAGVNIVASNDINEDTLNSLTQQGHEIDTFGVGTNLVTCQAQPALGGVFKLVEVDGNPRIKLSQDIVKVTIPGRKRAYRIYNDSDVPLLDLLVGSDEPAPEPGVAVLARHPFVETKRVYVKPTRVVELLELVWDGELIAGFPTLEESRAWAAESVAQLRPDITRSLNATPYKVSLTDDLYRFLHNMWQEEAPIPTLS